MENLVKFDSKLVLKSTHEYVKTLLAKNPSLKYKEVFKKELSQTWSIRNENKDSKGFLAKWKDKINTSVQVFECGYFEEKFFCFNEKIKSVPRLHLPAPTPEQIQEWNSDNQEIKEKYKNDLDLLKYSEYSKSLAKMLDEKDISIEILIDEVQINEVQKQVKIYAIAKIKVNCLFLKFPFGAKNKTFIFTEYGRFDIETPPDLVVFSYKKDKNNVLQIDPTIKNGSYIMRK